MPTLDNATLDDFMIPGLPGVTFPFGTKKPDGTSITSREANAARMMPFMRQRPHVIAQNTTTTRFDAFQMYEFTASGITLTLGDASFAGCRAAVANSTDGQSSVVSHDLVYFVEPGKVLHLDFVGGVWKPHQTANVGYDVTNVANSPTFNPGTGVGGITWTDPEAAFDHIEISDLLNPDAGAVSVAPGVQRFEPTEGTHRYKIQTVFSGGLKSSGVTLDETAYTIVYAANIVSVTVEPNAPRDIVLVFDNFVSCSSAAGFTLSGITDTLAFVNQGGVKSVRLRLAAKLFAQGGVYALNYDGTGTLTQSDNTPVPAWIAPQSIVNNSTYAPAAFVSAQIPQDEDQSLVLVMSRACKNIDYTKITLSGTTAAVAGLVSPTGSNASATIHLSLSEPVDAAETGIRLSAAAGWALDDEDQAAPVLTNEQVANNSAHTAIGVQSAQVTTAGNVLQAVMQGAVTIGGVTSGQGSPTGWSLTGTDKTITSWAISDGTITCALSGKINQGAAGITLVYDGSDTTFVDVAAGDHIMAFSVSVTNNSEAIAGQLIARTDLTMPTLTQTRYAYAAAAVGNFMFIYGGYNGSYLDTIECFEAM